MTDLQDRSPAEVSRRERKKDETRERIAHAALGLFRERGFVAATIDEIAQRADVAKGTFFNYFPRKEAVLAHVASAELDRLEELVDQALGEEMSARQRFHQVFTRACENYVSMPELSRVMFLEMMKGPEDALFDINERAHRAIRRLVDRAQDGGEVRPDADRDRVTEVLRGVFMSTTLLWLHAPRLFDLRTEIGARLSLVLDGLVTTEPR
jgi:AcrR family transcriptional regulator